MARLTLALLVLVIAAAATAVQAGDGRTDRCAAVVAGEIERLGLAESRIADIAYSRHSYNNRQDNRRVTRVQGWVDLADCEGYLVIDMTPRCRVRQVFTQGTCTMAGVPGC